MNKPTITRADVQQAAADKGMTELAAITLMQAGAVKLGDEATLETLCGIKSEIIGCKVYQCTSASYGDLAANNPNDLSDALEASLVRATLAGAEMHHEASNASARKELELAPDDLDWAEVCDGVWEATDGDLAMVYRITECNLGLGI